MILIELRAVFRKKEKTLFFHSRNNICAISFFMQIHAFIDEPKVILSFCAMQPIENSCKLKLFHSFVGIAVFYF